MARLSSVHTEIKPSASSQFYALHNKERQYYTALSALIDFSQGQKKHVNTYKAHLDFEDYKRLIVNQTSKLTPLNCSKSTPTENQFNVMYYQRAILSASEANYRNMAIFAAMHNLTPTALYQLIMLIKKACISLSKETKLAERKLNQKTPKARHAVVLAQKEVI